MLGLLGKRAYRSHPGYDSPKAKQHEAGRAERRVLVSQPSRIVANGTRRVLPCLITKVPGRTN